MPRVSHETQIRPENAPDDWRVRKLPPAVALNAERHERLDAYASLLTKWNPRINLVSPKDIGRLRERHIEDALQWTGLLPKNAPLLDLGSGGGIPAIVQAIALDAPLRMVESDIRKCAFLREAARICAVKAEIINERIENLDIPPAPVITARALAPLETLLEWSLPLLAPGGICVFPKGRNARQELTPVRKTMNINAEIFASETAPDAVIFRILECNRV